MQVQKLKKKQNKTSHTKVHITEISQTSHDRKAGYACGMTKKGRAI